MPHSPQLASDRQLLVIVIIWVLVLLDAIRQGITLPESTLVALSPGGSSYVLLLFAVFGPPIFVAANHLFPPRWAGGWSDWPQRIIDRRFGAGTARRFWQRLRPLALLSAAAFALGGTGYIASHRADAPSGAFEISGIFLGFGIGFLLGMVLERYVFKGPHAA